MDCSLADKYDDTWMFSDKEGDGQGRTETFHYYDCKWKLMLHSHQLNMCNYNKNPRQNPTLLLQ